MCSYIIKLAKGYYINVSPVILDFCCHRDCTYKSNTTDVACGAVFTYFSGGPEITLSLFCGVRVAQYSVFNFMFCIPLFEFVFVFCSLFCYGFVSSFSAY